MCVAPSETAVELLEEEIEESSKKKVETVEMDVATNDKTLDNSGNNDENETALQ